MHRFIAITLVLFGCLCALTQSSAGNGQALFDSLKCGACHKPDQKAVAVSLKEIALAYQDRAKMAAYFSGENPPIIDSAKAGMMKGQLKALAGLTDEERKAVADYILSFK